MTTTHLVVLAAQRSWDHVSHCNSSPTGQFNIQKVVPQQSGESGKVKVKVRVNVHGVFSVSSASLVEVIKSGEGEEPMETETPAKEDEVKRSVNKVTKA